MNILRSPTKGAKAKRVIHFGTRSCQLGITADLPDIRVPLAIPDYDGLLPITALGADLEVNIDWWGGALEQMRLQAAWKAFDPGSPGDPGDPDLVGTPYIITSADGPSTTFKVFVPEALLIHGVYLLRIRAASFPGNVIDWSPSIRVEVDTVAPGGGALPLLMFHPDVESTRTVTDDDIIGGKLPAQLAHYEGIARGDTLTPYLDNPLNADSVELGDIDTVPDFISIGFNEQALLDKGNGISFFGYLVTDKAGNFAGSGLVPLDIQLRTLPSNLLAPLVPQATDGLIDDADARAGVRVNIPTFTNPKDGDEIIVVWGNQRVAGNFLTPPDLGNDPILGIDLAYPTIFDAGNGTINVLYEVWRGIRHVGTSPSTPVVVDLALPGGPDPDPDDPAHGNLNPALVQGASGQDNVISPGDYIQPATAFIPWFAKNGDDYFQVGDVVVFTWGSQTALQNRHPITAGDVTAKDDLELIVTAATIAAEGSGPVPVFYTVERLTSVPPHSNISRSPDQIVRVTGPGDLPGGGNGVDVPSFPVLNVNQAIGQNELIGGAGSRYNPVHTRTDYLNVVAGDTVELFFVGYDDLFAGNLVPGAAYNPPPHVLTQTEIDNDLYEFRVPAIHHIAVCSQGAVEARVVFTNSIGSISSNTTRVFCDVKNPGSPNCDDIAP